MRVRSYRPSSASRIASEYTSSVVEQLVLEGRDCGEALRVDSAPDTPPERRGRVLPEVEAVLPKHPCQQEGELDLLEVVAGRWVLAGTGRPAGCDRGCHVLTCTTRL